MLGQSLSSAAAGTDQMQLLLEKLLLDELVQHVVFLREASSLDQCLL